MSGGDLRSSRTTRQVGSDCAQWMLHAGHRAKRAGAAQLSERRRWGCHSPGPSRPLGAPCGCPLDAHWALSGLPTVQENPGMRILCAQGASELSSTLCNPMDYSLPGSSIHGFFQARVLEWVAISFSRGSSWPRDQTQVSRIAGRRLPSEPPETHDFSTM